MLSYPELTTMTRSLRGERALSVYVDSEVRDPAERRAWKLELEHALRQLRSRLANSTHEQREMLERSVGILEERLDEPDGPDGAIGWVAFVTPERVLHAERLAVPTPTIVAWDDGIHVAPYIRALRDARPVVVLVGDARKASIYRYADAQLQRLETLRARTNAEPPVHMGDSPRVGFHPGVRGSTGREEAQRARTRGTEQMLDEAADRVARAAGRDAWIVIGGIPRVVQRAAERITRSAPGRVLELEALDVHSSESRIEEAARKGAAALRDALELRRVKEAIEQAKPKGAAVIGPTAARSALEERRVREIFFTSRWLEDHPEDAERVVSAALAQRASVSEVSGEAARLLDEHGGVAALLRFARGPARATDDSAA